jgi:hypothetical protein
MRPGSISMNAVMMDQSVVRLHLMCGNRRAGDRKDERSGRDLCFLHRLLRCSSGSRQARATARCKTGPPLDRRTVCYSVLERAKRAFRRSASGGIEVRILVANPRTIELVLGGIARAGGGEISGVVQRHLVIGVTKVPRVSRLVVALPIYG